MTGRWEPTPLLPGDRVRHRNAGIGTVVPNTDPHLQTSGVTCVDMDREDIPDGLYFRTADLRLAGTRCIPFEQMTPQQQADHLRITHGIRHLPRGPLTADLLWLWGHQHHDDHLDPTVNVRVIPHTHRKEPRT